MDFTVQWYLGKEYIAAESWIEEGKGEEVRSSSQRWRLVLGEDVELVVMEGSPMVN